MLMQRSQRIGSDCSRVGRRCNVTEQREQCCENCQWFGYETVIDGWWCYRHAIPTGHLGSCEEFEDDDEEEDDDA
jgi:hypothetical protein